MDIKVEGIAKKTIKSKKRGGGGRGAVRKKGGGEEQGGEDAQLKKVRKAIFNIKQKQQEMLTLLKTNPDASTSNTKSTTDIENTTATTTADSTASTSTTPAIHQKLSEPQKPTTRLSAYSKDLNSNVNTSRRTPSPAACLSASGSAASGGSGRGGAMTRHSVLPVSLLEARLLRLTFSEREEQGRWGGGQSVGGWEKVDSDGWEGGGGEEIDTEKWVRGLGSGDNAGGGSGGGRDGTEEGGGDASNLSSKARSKAGRQESRKTPVKTSSRNSSGASSHHGDSRRNEAILGEDGNGGERGRGGGDVLRGGKNQALDAKREGLQGQNVEAHSWTNQHSVIRVSVTKGHVGSTPDNDGAARGGSGVSIGGTPAATAGAIRASALETVSGRRGIAPQYARVRALAWASVPQLGSDDAQVADDTQETQEDTSSVFANFI